MESCTQDITGHQQGVCVTARAARTVFVPCGRGQQHSGPG
jgi:hypothetical protein